MQRLGWSDLPEKIRTKIYRSLFVYDKPVNLEHLPKLSGQFLRGSKQIHEEGRAVLYSNVFDITLWQEFLEYNLNDEVCIPSPIAWRTIKGTPLLWNYGFHHILIASDLMSKACIGGLQQMQDLRSLQVKVRGTYQDPRQEGDGEKSCEHAKRRIDCIGRQYLEAQIAQEVFDLIEELPQTDFYFTVGYVTESAIKALYPEADDDDLLLFTLSRWESTSILRWRIVLLDSGEWSVAFVDESSVDQQQQPIELQKQRRLEAPEDQIEAEAPTAGQQRGIEVPSDLEKHIPTDPLPRRVSTAEIARHFPGRVQPASCSVSENSDVLAGFDFDSFLNTTTDDTFDLSDLPSMSSSTHPEDLEEQNSVGTFI